MVDPISITAIIVSAGTALSAALAALHIRKMKSGCLDCDCMPGTPSSRTSTLTKNHPVIVLADVPAKGPACAQV